MKNGVRTVGKWVVLGVALIAGLAGCKVEEFPPELWSVNPKQFEIGRTIDIEGAQFGNDPIVTFGEATTAIRATVQSRGNRGVGELLTVVVPRMPTGQTQIQVANSQGMTPPLPFTVVQPQPLFTTITPTNTPPGGNLRIVGENLDQIVSIRFDTTRAASYTVVSPNEVLVTVSRQLPRGDYTLNYVTEGGTAKTTYLVAGTPEINSFSPRRARAGQEVVITGRYLADAQVWFNRASVDPATMRSTDTEIRAIVPNDASTGPITVRTFNRLNTTSRDSLYIAGTPVIASGPVPSEGIVGDKVIINGFSFRDVSNVTFGTLQAQFRILSDTQIEAIVPVRSQAGNVSVTLSGLGGTVTANQPFFYIQAPSNITFAPLRRGRGKQVTVTGQNLWRIQSLTLNGRTTIINSRNEGTDLLFFLGADDRSGLITVTNRAGSATSARSLTIVEAATVTDYPRRVVAGTRMIIKGTWLRDAVVQFQGAANAALFDGRNEDNEIWVRVPDDAQTGSFQLTNDATGAFASEGVTIIKPSANIAFTPTAAKVGDEITITGTFLDDVTDVRFSGGASLPAVFTRGFNNLKVIVPANANTGTICLTNPAGFACSAGTFTVQRLVSGLSFTPQKGLTGTEVTISGQNLADVTEVKFGGGKSTPAQFRRVGGTLVVTVPTDATDGTLCLTTAGGTVCTTDSYDVLIPIANAATTATTAKVGAEVIVTGTNVMSAVEVRFSGGRSSVARFRVVGNTLAVTVPTDAANGTICLTNEAGTVCTKESVVIEK